MAPQRSKQEKTGLVLGGMKCTPATIASRVPPMIDRRAVLLTTLLLCVAASAAAAQPGVTQEEREAGRTMDGGPTPAGERLQVAVLLYDHALLLDWAIPAEILRAAGHGEVFSVYTVTEDGEPIASMLPATVAVDHSLADAPPPDVVLVPGGNWVAMRGRHAVHDWLWRARNEGSIIMSICTGAYVLAEVGLLNGRESTSLHSQLELLRKLAPMTTVRADLPFVADDGVVTSAGAATAIDAALWVVEELAGKEVADTLAAQYLDYERRPASPSGS